LHEIEKGTSEIGCAEEGEMKSGTSLSSNSGNLGRKEMGERFAREQQSCRRDDENECNPQAVRQTETALDDCRGDLPERVRAAVVVKRGVYDARRLRSQREVIRDVMLAAAECDTWLTLAELRALTHFGEASISAQLRHLRKLENGGHDVCKQRREGAIVAAVSADGRGECVWEYRIMRTLQAGQGAGTLMPHEMSMNS
jgi:hypothetical protein